MATTDLQVILKAKDLAEHTLRITSNCNRYPKKYRFSLVDKMQIKSMEIYESLMEANRTDIKAWDMDRFPFIYEETNGLPCGLPNFLTFKNMHINHMLIECNYVFKERAHIDKNKIRHVIRGHHSLENCVGFIKRNKTPDLRNIILCHLSGENADPETMQKEVQSVTGKWVKVDVAHAGDEYLLSKYPWD